MTRVQNIKLLILLLSHGSRRQLLWILHHHFWTEFSHCVQHAVLRTETCPLPLLATFYIQNVAWNLVHLRWYNKVLHCVHVQWTSGISKERNPVQCRPLKVLKTAKKILKTMFFSASLEFVLHKQVSLSIRAHTANKSSLLSSIKCEYSNYQWSSVTCCVSVFSTVTPGASLTVPDILSVFCWPAHHFNCLLTWELEFKLKFSTGSSS